MLYLFKTILCSATFLFVYFLFLEKERMYRFNRFYLLGSIFYSLLIPLMTITVEKDTPLYLVNEYIFISENVSTEVAPLTSIQPVQTTISTESFLLYAYWLVTAFFLVLLMVNLYKLYAKIRQGKSIDYKGNKLVLIEEEIAPHSFLDYIFINKTSFGEGRVEREILHHELTHVKQGHTIDVLLIEFIAAFLWFNPFIYLYKRAIKLNHEFLADEGVVNKFQNITGYQFLLLGKTNQQPAPSITSQFNFLITKKRLSMITKYTSRRIAILKKSFVLLMITTAIFVFSSKVLLAQEVENDTKPIEQLTTLLQDPVKIPDTTILKDTTKPTRRNFYAGGTKEGVSPELLNEYHSIIDRYKTAEVKWFEFEKNIPRAEIKRLEEIFLQMSLQQQSKENVVFMRPFPPGAKVVPTQKQFNSFKNSKIYGVWINEKKVPNSELDKYSADDFSKMDISKLYGAAKKGRTYSHQVDLMTNDYYQSYRASTIADKSNKMVFQSFRPQKR